jgi:hypothetical protein
MCCCDGLRKNEARKAEVMLQTNSNVRESANSDAYILVAQFFFLQEQLFKAREMCSQVTGVKRKFGSAYLQWICGFTARVVSL